MAVIFIELMQSNPNLTSIKAPNYEIDDTEALLIKQSLDTNTELNELVLNYAQDDNPKKNLAKLKQMVFKKFSKIFNYEKPIKTQLQETVLINKSIFELRQYLQSRRDEIEMRPYLIFTAIPWDVLMQLGDEIIINSLKSGFSKKFTQAALDEFLLSMHAGGISRNKILTNS